jgi:hypothetical protein
MALKARLETAKDQDAQATAEIETTTEKVKTDIDTEKIEETDISQAHERLESTKSE